MKTAWWKYQRAWGWILLLSLIVGAAMGVYTYGYEPDIYESFVELYVTPGDARPSTEYDPAVDEMIGRECQALLAAPSASQAIESKLAPLLMDAWRVEVQGVPNTHMVKVIAIGTDAELCQATAIAASVVLTEQLEAATEWKNVSVVSRAQLPAQPAGPQRVLKILATFALCFVGLSFLFFLLVSKQETLCADDASKMELGVPLVGRISDYRRDLSRFFKKKGPQPRILCQWVNRSSIEEIKTLSLCLCSSEEKKIRSVVMASYEADEGKSSLAVLLGSELCNQGKRVLLVDMDCYSPTLGRLLGAHGKKDLIHHLGGEATLEQVILPTGMANLFFIDNVHPESLASRMVGSKAFAAFMNRMHDEFDYILFDTPPVSLFADAAVLGSVLDGTLLIVAEHRLTSQKLKDVVQKLQTAHSKLLGIAFSFVPNKLVKQFRDYEDVGKGRHA